MLATVGVAMELRAAENSADRGGKPVAKSLVARASLGARTTGEGNDLKITHVLDGGAAQAAGLAANDIVVAIDGIRVTPRTWDALLAQRKPGESARLAVFRRDELQEIDVTFSAPPLDTCVLRFEKQVSARALRLRKGWLGTHGK